MSHTAQELLIIYETEADQWAKYLHSVFAGPISEDGICCYDIAAVSNRQEDFLELGGFTCKLLILSRGMLETLCPIKRFFLARVLSPAACVVVLLCGVESLTPLLDLVPLDGDQCLQISSEQDPHEYLPTVTDIVRKGVSANVITRKPSRSEQKPEQTPSADSSRVGSRNMVVVPPRVPCRVRLSQQEAVSFVQEALYSSAPSPRQSSTEVFILLRTPSPGGRDAEVEFTRGTRTERVKPVCWNDRTLCVTAPGDERRIGNERVRDTMNRLSLFFATDFPAGNVSVTVSIDRVPVSKAQLQYYSSMEEVARLLSTAADPVDFMCQALQVSSVEKLDQRLSSTLLEVMPSGGFQGLQQENTPETDHRQVDVPSLLHFAARYGLTSVSSLLLQCPGAKRAMHTIDCRGRTPTEIAKSHGHTELHVLLEKTLNMFNSSENDGDASVYEMMCTAGSSSSVQRAEGEGEEDPYAVGDEYDTILTSQKPGAVASRPPAPAPRPESTRMEEDRTPYITQVFHQKNSPQSEASLYSLPTKQARGQEGSISSTYDTFVPNKMQELQQLVELQLRRHALDQAFPQGALSYSPSQSHRTEYVSKNKPLC
ncbi:B-cell scaffold protein with ankyrin repeats-like [Aulostomus maculatus]